MQKSRAASFIEGGSAWSAVVSLNLVITSFHPVAYFVAVTFKEVL